MKGHLKRFIKYFTSVHPLINFFAISSLFFTVGYEFWLKKLPEAFNGGFELSIILSQLSLATFSSYIFYVIVVKKKEVDDWENIKPTVALWVLRITSQYKSQLGALEESSGVKIDHTNLDSINEALKCVSPWDNCRLRISSKDGSSFNWYTCLVLDQDDLEINIDKLMNISPFLDSELVAILNKLTGLEVKLMLETFINNVEGDNLTFIKGVFFNYCSVCDELNDYRLKYLDIFK